MGSYLVVLDMDEKYMTTNNFLIINNWNRFLNKKKLESFFFLLNSVVARNSPFLM